MSREVYCRKRLNSAALCGARGSSVVVISSPNFSLTFMDGRSSSIVSDCTVASQSTSYSTTRRTTTDKHTQNV